MPFHQIDLLQVLLSTELYIIPCCVNCPTCVFEYRFSDMFALISIFRSTHDNALPKIGALIFYSCYMLRADKSSVWRICEYRLTSYKKVYKWYITDIYRVSNSCKRCLHGYLYLPIRSVFDEHTICQLLQQYIYMNHHSIHHILCNNHTI